MNNWLKAGLFIVCWPCLAQEPIVVIAEGEAFVSISDPASASHDTLYNNKGWVLTPQDQSYASHTYGGMWVTHGALLGAPADSEGAIAEQIVSIPATGDFRVWSKYQAPPYFNYLHRIEIEQAGQVLYSETYGRPGTPRLWSFAQSSDDLWLYWGVDHDAAEAPDKSVQLQQGRAIIRLITEKNPSPAGKRMVDFIVLTTNQNSNYIGREPYSVATPFANEALAATRLYMRFKNSSDQPAQLKVKTRQHFQPNYRGSTKTYPDQAVAPGAWSEWVNVGPDLRLVHNEAMTPELQGADTIEIEFARDEDGKQLIAAINVAKADKIYIPIDIVWNHNSRITTTRELGTNLTALANTWPKANNGKKPRKFPFYGVFKGTDWSLELKDALGFNTLLPDKFDHIKIDGYFQHARNGAAIRKLASEVDVRKQRIVSFGDEIRFSPLDLKVTSNQTLKPLFANWLKSRGVSEEELGMPLSDAHLRDALGNARLNWYATLFWEEYAFDHYKTLTQIAKKEFGKRVLTGANFSPHLPPQYYGSIGQWVDAFRHDAMSMYWSEDYIFSVPEPPQILSWHFAMMRAAVRYNKQPIHYYVMPHAPGQPSEELRRAMVFAVGNGASSLDSFWVGPQEEFTENYIAWQYRDSFKAIHDTIYQTAEVERMVLGGKRRGTRVAIVLSKATQINEDKLIFNKQQDPFTRNSANADQGFNHNRLKQVMCRKEQQALYLALRRAQYDVDLITEDDIYARDALANYAVVYFAGEWIDTQIIKPLKDWVKAGGTLYASAGLGHMNQFGEQENGMLEILGLRRSQLTKKLYNVRPLLELPLAETLDTISFGNHRVEMIGWHQPLNVESAQSIGQWSDGSTAVTRNQLGKGQAIAVGGLPGLSWQKTGLRPLPFARGGSLNLYHPDGFEAGATALATLGLHGSMIERSVITNNPSVEASIIDYKQKSVLTLVPWTNRPANDLSVQIAMRRKPRKIYSVSTATDIPFTWAGGIATLEFDLSGPDFIVIK